MIGIYARADHPEGWGFCNIKEREQQGMFGVNHGHRAHGYVVIAVRCKSRKELDAVTTRLRRPFYGPEGVQQYSDGAMGEWYGGVFDHVATVPGNKIEFPWMRFSTTATASSIGDNRFAGVFEASVILGSPAPSF